MYIYISVWSTVELLLKLKLMITPFANNVVVCVCNRSIQVQNLLLRRNMFGWQLKLELSTISIALQIRFCANCLVSFRRLQDCLIWGVDDWFSQSWVNTRFLLSWGTIYNIHRIICYGKRQYYYCGVNWTESPLGCCNPFNEKRKKQG